MTKSLSMIKFRGKKEIARGTNKLKHSRRRLKKTSQKVNRRKSWK